MTRTILAATAALALLSACAAQPAPDTKAETYQGVTVQVPAGWGLNQLRCGTPIRNTVVLNPPTFQEDCALRLLRPVDYVELRSCIHDLPGDAWMRTTCGSDSAAAVAHWAVEVRGKPARTGETRLSDGTTEVVLAIPDRGVVVKAVSVDPSVARGIVDSASIS
jgi:hypothetical protein